MSNIDNDFLALAKLTAQTAKPVHEPQYHTAIKNDIINISGGTHKDVGDSYVRQTWDHNPFGILNTLKGDE